MIGEVKAGRYEIVEELGRGGMGVVYGARDGRLGRKVALKMIPREVIDNTELRRRLGQEARAASALGHAGVATVYDFVDQGEESFIVYEYVEGVTLRQKLDHRFSTEGILDVGVQIAEALAVAHERGIIHRDLKPENVMLTATSERSAHVKILDFGLAKLPKPIISANEMSSIPTDTSPISTGAGLLVGTVNYMSPEQVEGEPADQRADLYALGLVLYEMATGTNPFAGKTTASTIANILKQEAPPVRERNPVAPAELDRILRKCLRKRREERYQSAQELLGDLSDLRREMTKAGEPSGSAAGSEQPGILRRLFAFIGPTPQRWWELNHLGTLLIFFPIFIYLGWKVSEWAGGSLGLFLFFAELACVAIQIGLRLFLLVTGAFNPKALSAEVRRVGIWIRLAHFLMVIIFLGMASAVAVTHTGLAAVLVVLGIAGILISLVAEPAIDRAAFPSPDRSPEAAAAIGEGPPGATASARSQAGPVLEIPRGLARALFLVIQVGYLTMYAAAFYLFQKGSGPTILPFTIEFQKRLFIWVLMAALAGTPLRLYLLSAVGFDYFNTGRLFRQMFPLVMLFDIAWAVAPLLLYPQLGLAVLLIVPALAYLPFSQRTLVLSAYAATGGRTSGVRAPGSP